MSRGLKILLSVLAVIVVLIVALVIFIATFDWNRAKPWINNKVSEELGRPFAINGDLSVHWRRPPNTHGWRGWFPWPHVSAKDLTIGNPDWAKDPHLAQVGAVDFDVAIPPLLAKEVSIPEIHLENPQGDLERRADGSNTWTFRKRETGKPSAWTVDFGDLTFAKGVVKVRDETKKVDLEVGVDTLGQPIPFGEALKQQGETSRKQSAEFVGSSGAQHFSKAAAANASSEAASVSKAGSAPAASAPASAAAVAHAGSGSSDNAAQGNGATSAASTAERGANVSQTDAHAAVDQAHMPSQPYQLAFTVKGSYNNAPVKGNGRVGGVLTLQDKRAPYPVQADVRIGDIRVALVGTVTSPADLQSIDLRLWLSGVSMAKFYPLTGVTLPDTKPFATEGRLRATLPRGDNNKNGETAKSNGGVYRYENFTGRVGGSDLNGTLVYEAVKPRPKLTGELLSHNLVFDDLGPLIGAGSNNEKKQRGDAKSQPSDKALPVEPFKTDRWNALDADVKFTGQHIVRDKSLPINNLYTHIVMRNAVLSLEPLRFGVAGGTINSNIRLDGSGTPMKGKLDLTAQHMKLKQLFPTFQPMQTSLGELNGKAALSATGNSVAALLGASNGEIKMLVNDGRISTFLMEAAGLNVANAVIEKLYGNRTVVINCMASDFAVTNGVVNSKLFLFDTEDSIINIDGTVNLKSEEMDLGVHPHTKGFRIFSLRSPLHVRGTFKHPKVGVDALPLIARGGGAIALGLINPLAALIPLIAPSNNKDAPCGQLLSQMRTGPSAPPPGKTRSPNAGGTLSNDAVLKGQDGAKGATPRGNATRGSAPASESPFGAARP
ncbi:AsmA family protein [Chitinasiproducens palmae]|uniref:AsmA domain-containing protein n=1 Tax=Chitinasiproducens palmae TaxID=1770053 RepID=A0A1H2PW72_9BURK|nr:AsmA family protein [Chitinasiproducens palmae]SDV51590.1 hypothetical protein SAMN05216551_11910 [Chitinasiproducens palmae]